MSTDKEDQMEPKIAISASHEEFLSNRDAASIGVAEEHTLTIKDVFRKHKRIVFFCLFYSMSAVGCKFTGPLSDLARADSFVGGFDAQVNGAMISVNSVGVPKLPRRTYN
jgi:hypothetical protein